MMTKENAKRRERDISAIRHPFGNGMTTRFLRALPAFKVVDDLPEHLRELLDRLENAERERTSDGRA